MGSQPAARDTVTVELRALSGLSPGYQASVSRTRSSSLTTGAPADPEVLEGEHLLSETAHAGIRTNASKP